MSIVNSLVLRGSGLNCNDETQFALELAGSKVVQAHINELVEKKIRLEDFQIMVIPGGFAYGDDLGAGKVMANKIKHTLKSGMQEFVDSGKLLAGICNGFQILVKTGFLPDNCKASLTNNDSGHFEDRWVHVKPASDSLFVKGIKSMYIPINHGEGKFVVSEESMRLLKSNNQIALKYCDSSLFESSAYPINPNGSMENISGITSKKGNVFGMMPHPEKFINRLQHPRWTREKLPEVGDGFAIFRNMVTYAESKLV